MKMRIAICIVALVLAGTAFAADDTPPPQVLFKNVNIFNGTDDRLYENQQVLVEGNKIKEISAGEIEAGSQATVVDGGGRTLMPGLIDMHVHTATFGPLQTLSRDMLHPYAHGALAADRAHGMLLNGFTTVRDLGGPANYLRKIIDAGVLPGPRIYPTENWITTTSGHGDFRELNDPHPNIAAGRQHFYEDYVTIIADGRDEHLRAAREAFRRGATQLKIFTGGGVTSLFDPLHSGPLDEEVRAVVEVAERWDTYVAVHAHTEQAIQQAIDNGIKSIEHAPYLTENQAKSMIEKGLFLSTAFSPVFSISEEKARSAYPPESFTKWLTIRNAAKNTIEVIKKNPDLKVVVASDHIPQWDTGRAYDDKAVEEFKYFSEAIGNFRTLKAFTSTAGELNMMTGKMNPYPDSQLGIIEQGAYADILVVDGNPLEDIEIMMAPDKNVKIIMKDGVIYKNTLLYELVQPELDRKIKEITPYMYGDYDHIE
jgi:imidazolonepropionase-like amidohydrolase